ncbi:hypothetical protein [Geobacter sp. SVR]|uniref:capsid assembly protein n=1 Tax=Geobacter sp. SVR TaxID=2495594 RepID=UPI00143EF6C2|nr:hypothetical protein [Geobacter sp. SVR]BCS53310.1 hypothetical protein GSVR_16180 [Geobacter sp. SVR]GCF85564.1 hypothetical protein GSbR_21640 [Geobacter sp. SVR]
MSASSNFTVPVTPNSPAADPTYNDRMIAKAEGRTYVPPVSAEPAKQEEKKPDSKPTPEVKPEEGRQDYKKLYEELLAKQAPPPKKEEEHKPADGGDGKTPEEKAAEEALKNQGLNLSDFQKEFDEKGELSPESYQKLEKAGIDKATVDSYIAGQKAIAEALTNSLHGAAGGTERYTEMLEWAKGSLKPEEIQAFNSAVTSGDMTKAELAVKGLYAQFTNNVGEPPQGLLKGNPNGGTTSAFSSRAEMTAAIADPKYHRDPVYRAEVEKKIQNSKLF